MDFLKKLMNNRQNKSFQGETGERNRAALRALSGLGFSLPKIRKALVGLNDLNLAKIAGDKVSIPTVHNTLNDRRDNPIAKSRIAETLHLNTNELFPG